jgi:hypothetical protein
VIGHLDEDSTRQQPADQQGRNAAGGVGKPLVDEAEQRRRDHDPRGDPPQRDVPAVAEIVDNDKRERAETRRQRGDEASEEDEYEILECRHI